MHVLENLQTFFFSSLTSKNGYQEQHKRYPIPIQTNTLFLQVSNLGNSTRFLQTHVRLLSMVKRFAKQDAVANC